MAVTIEYATDLYGNLPDTHTSSTLDKADDYVQEVAEGLRNVGMDCTVKYHPGRNLWLDQNGTVFYRIVEA